MAVMAAAAAAMKDLKARLRAVRMREAAIDAPCGRR